ncbi:flagellin [Alterisphingorhabdus coralli]|uniref:Flagellin n=1 Tax=Alterisphingorhabdus coralli TaxID=3071408 RepID=A0AA97F5I5_9SPHN|nr:flagellin [Parasphingorhabdus sp. SCSIO 66989]WOE74744.1 flagellin [Parasphingorhabdus sp. SCSIO 66989]
MVESINRNRPPVAVQNQLNLSEAIDEENRAISTQRRLNRASDDPQGWVEISSLSRQQSNEQAWTNNIGRAQTRASQAESALDTMSSILIRANELLVQAANGTLNDNDREGIALEMEGVLETIRDLVVLDDGYGGELFPPDPLSIPIGEDRNITATPSLDELTTNIGPAGETLEQVLTNTIDAVRTGTTADRQNRLPAVDAAIERISTMLTQQGVTSNTLEAARVQYEDSNLALAERRSAIEDTNVAEAITRLQSLSTSLEAAQAVYARIEQRSLLDFI